MFFQLGNIVFTGLLRPKSFGVEGDEATYAEHELIGSKTRLQKTGDSLQELTFEITLRAEFCNPATQLTALKTAKDAGTIMPFLWGDGRYVNDYVVTKFPYTIDETFDDGTIIQATVTLTIREYVSYNAMEQQQLGARKAAFAVGVKNPVIQRPPQPVSELKAIAQTVTAAKQQTTMIDKLTNDYKNATAGAAVVANRIKEACTKANTAFMTLNTQLDNARAVDDEFNLVRSSAGNVAASVKAVEALYPYTSVDALTKANTLLQGSVSSLDDSASGMNRLVIIRQPVAVPAA